MSKLLIITAIIFLFVCPLIAQAQEVHDQAYDFKGDKLGMSLEEFTARHPGNGVWVYRQNCKDKKTWESNLCKDGSQNLASKNAVSGFTSCSYMTTMAEFPAGVTALFADGKLAALSVGFSRPPTSTLALVSKGLSDKFGPAVSELRAEVSRGSWNRTLLGEQYFDS